jgi:hypothetical protein
MEGRIIWHKWPEEKPEGSRFLLVIADNCISVAMYREKYNAWFEGCDEEIEFISRSGVLFWGWPEMPEDHPSVPNGVQEYPEQGIAR